MDIFEKVLRFLLNNPFLAVILIGFVFSILRKGNKPANRMPSFGGDTAGQRPGSEPDDRDAEPDDMHEEERSYPVYPVYREEERGSLAGMPQGYSSEDSITLEERVAAMKPAVRPAGAARHENSSKKESAAAAHAAIRPEEALKGVLWSEILEPPRAKRPYGRRSS
ncbi:hypothetical protein WJ0W_002411 [Paenibacillus melissococcoides]|uniref:Uncharacterized protein n=1 Tax=Paenibacillus melissococcoides TaxID=2912268 RepID=A0ABM9G1S1_9BACL|nr:MULTISPECIES: hypothetical protein [Paenibacillus]MEB9895374.1 hypothetical protein [Bacillus cereus]CAH8245181.1 hypothetical protein WJ0W_002411 [Paenibacillus melissococcoides]CAH8710211.1 hypothetical protein WDD9_002493 [Paenibacillus melissococcoides]CAH8710980.1 hypothetical protein HTL2_002793 [Paenibacillus melissococcoides]GIO79757.1 hypothetical protein J6TS7_33670 [Paenibacillus dendritiformis]